MDELFKLGSSLSPSMSLMASRHIIEALNICINVIDKCGLGGCVDTDEGTDISQGINNEEK